MVRAFVEDYGSVSQGPWALRDRKAPLPGLVRDLLPQWKTYQRKRLRGNLDLWEVWENLRVQGRGFPDLDDFLGGDGPAPAI